MKFYAVTKNTKGRKETRLYNNAFADDEEITLSEATDELRHETEIINSSLQILCDFMLGIVERKELDRVEDARLMCNMVSDRFSDFSEELEALFASDYMEVE